MKADAFARDLEQKPATLRDLADHLDREDPWGALGSRSGPVVFLGMGSSHYAASVAAARMRARGVPAVAELASSDLLPRVDDDTTVVAVSASGGSRETLDALGRIHARAAEAGARPYVVALTNVEGSALTERADLVVPMLAGVEAGGVACRSFQHTLALLLALEDRRGGEAAGGTPISGRVRAAADAAADLLAREDDWRPAVTEALIGPDGSHLAAPARRLSSAQQSALMLREGPRVAAVGCETGDWAHVDVYLTKNTDYRLLLFGGSRWLDGVREWTDPRGTTIVSVGEDLETAAVTVRYTGDDLDDVALLSETLVPELVAARMWTAQAST
ncbi:SIS domain-containing protein [Mumia flava]|uniref:Glutamine--fructose-6-phosphate aminotransferase [isomerizing] n=1 Tax=Mumia flava TaxID=1348852 RepID=A0A0B2BPC3_9ACTN|nr:SIS domain-containing protein [Mumia flava]PJJ53684.1 SIS domain-containing protein [Mumia flava]